MKKIEIINGLRGIAILAVIHFHYFSRFTPAGFGAVQWNGFVLFPLTFFANGLLGVNLFFILSGFVLYLPYAHKQREMRKFDDAGKYYRKRAKRLLPLYYFNAIFCMVLVNKPHGMENAARDIFLLLTATFNFTKDMWFPSYNGVLWSIGIEIWFSVFFPFIVISFNKFKPLKIFLIISACSLLIRGIGYSNDFFTLGANLHLNALKDSLVGRLDDFVLGMLLAHFYVSTKNCFQKPTTLYLQFFSGIFILFLACSLWDYCLLGILHNSMIPLTNNIAQAGFFLIIYSALFIKKGIVRACLTNWPIQVLGMMCYSIYVWHAVGVWPLDRGVYSFWSVLMAIAFMLTLSAFSYRYIEFGHIRDTKSLFLLRREG